ncbi:MAG: heme A synthase, partial [Alphaproteobacteria bacterium]|nr:heme A synthase [Alphaproteobacteria bacterium]
MKRDVAIWLFTLAASVVVLVLVGGLTRLTDSGLSITQWQPIAGIVPPLTDEAWAQAFALYRQIPEYQLINHGMSLADFQYIYWWEWAHRALGRMVGLIFLVPFIIFLMRRR